MIEIDDGRCSLEPNSTRLLRAYKTNRTKNCSEKAVERSLLFIESAYIRFAELHTVIRAVHEEFGALVQA